MAGRWGEEDQLGIKVLRNPSITINRGIEDRLIASTNFLIM